MEKQKDPNTGHTITAFTVLAMNAIKRKIDFTPWRMKATRRKAHAMKNIILARLSHDLPSDVRALVHVQLLGLLTAIDAAYDRGDVEAFKAAFDALKNYQLPPAAQHHASAPLRY